jgi:hypothetical protein
MHILALDLGVAVYTAPERRGIAWLQRLIFDRARPESCDVSEVARVLVVVSHALAAAPHVRDGVEVEQHDARRIAGNENALGRIWIDVVRVQTNRRRDERDLRIDRLKLADDGPHHRLKGARGGSRLRWQSAHPYRSQQQLRPGQMPRDVASSCEPMLAKSSSTLYFAYPNWPESGKMRTSGRSQALFGGLLWGDWPVRYIFIDEAGISAKETVTVVVGIIAHADEHVMSAEALALETLNGVPRGLRDGFTFSAKNVFGDEAHQQAGWSLTDRLDLLSGMMSIPRRIGMAISIGVAWRGTIECTEEEKKRYRPEQWDHFRAFTTCVARADRGIRQHAGPREVATIVAEDVPELKGLLKSVPHMLRTKGTVFPSSHMRLTETDQAAGHLTQSGDMRVERIRNSVHFVEKNEDPLVQVADACAYGFRRYFEGQKFGVEFARAIVGDENALKDFGPPSGGGCFWPQHLAFR